MSKKIASDKLVVRRFAIELLGKKMTIGDVAQVAGVSESSIKRWKRAFELEGDDGLQLKPHPGRPAKLDDEQRGRLRQILIDGPLAAGFDTDLWTCRRVAEVVQRTFDVEYHPDHLGRILHDLGFSPQKPQRRASERDEAAIERWREREWPRIKKTRDARALRSCFSRMRLRPETAGMETAATKASTLPTYATAARDSGHGDRRHQGEYAPDMT